MEFFGVVNAWLGPFQLLSWLKLSIDLHVVANWCTGYLFRIPASFVDKIEMWLCGCVSAVSSDAHSFGSSLRVFEAAFVVRFRFFSILFPCAVVRFVIHKQRVRVAVAIEYFLFT